LAVAEIGLEGKKVSLISENNGALRPVTIKDFAVGQTAYHLYEPRRGETNYNPEEFAREYEEYIQEYKVTAIGRKYLNVKSAWPRRFYLENKGDAYLTEDRDWGYPTKLFPNRETLNAYGRKNY